MFKAAIRINKITSIAQLRGATLHAERGDETSQARLREGAEPGAALAWCKASQSDRDYLTAFKAHKAEMSAGERKGAPLCMQALCVISPEWVKAAGDLHDPDNPRNRALFDQATAWAESWAGKGSVFGARLDLDEAGGAVVDLMIAPVRDSRGKPVISTQKALVELKAATGERNEYSALQTSWADWASQHLDAQIERGTRRMITDRQHLSPETYGLVKDKAREEVLQDQTQAPALIHAFQSASGLPPRAIDDLRDLLLLQREIQAHRRDPRGYTAPGESNLTPKLVERVEHDAWPTIWEVRKDAEKIIEIAGRRGINMDSDRGGYTSGRDFFPALADRMHLTAVVAKCAEFCAKAEAFVKNTLGYLRGEKQPIIPDHSLLWPNTASAAVARNEINLGLRAPEVTKTIQRQTGRETPAHSQDSDNDLEL
jgi:Plasmid recombination enzyme